MPLPLTHGTHCACDRCRVAYAMHYRFEWQGVPPDVAVNGLYTRGQRGEYPASCYAPRRPG